MPKWTVTLPNGSKTDLDEPYGITCEVKESGRYFAEIIISPANQRVQVLSYEGQNLSGLAHRLSQIATANGFGKVWLKARADDEEALQEAGFETEATIPRYFNGDDACIMAIFPRDDRRNRPERAKEAEILAGATSGARPTEFRDLPDGYKTTLFSDSDAVELAALYGEVFPSYPYPITDPEYLKATARTHIIYRLIRNAEGKLVAAASAETVPDKKNSEMTDFASLPSERGKGLAQYLLRRLESDAVERFGIKCFYTIARAASYGMLKTFHNCGYKYTGTLVNNCHISGRFETMLVMVKP